MNASRRIVVFTLTAGLILTTLVATAQVPVTPRVPRKPLRPSVLGGKPTTINVYNYSGKTVSPFWVDPSGTIQPVPDGKPVPPMTGKKPYPFPTFVGATVGFRIPGAGGVVNHVGGRNPEPFIVVGDPPKGAELPAGYVRRQAAKANPSRARAGNAGNAKRASDDDDDEGGNFDEKAFAGVPLIVVEPTTPERGRRRGRGNADIDVNITTPGTTDNGAAAAKKPSSPSSERGAADKSDSKRARLLKADSPAVVEFLRIHNAARADVGASPLEWSDDLARTAQRWAEHLAKNDKNQHRADTEYGELIATGGGDFTVAKAANGWLSEKADFSIDQEPKYRATEMLPTEDGKTMLRDRDGPTAHYTQMIWGKSTMVGVGIAKTEGGKVVVVANYNPRGNVAGEKPY